ncbi:hypothetical protein TWF481_012271 [Arthrobotrys musiformis]|uniref:F-box domain-containing protein n=1 Tax=Arthrobotrys musiformis TaxID=47236 RepID=A0AAV9VY09_9PEZI
MSDHTIPPASTHLIARFPWAPSLPSALFDLTPSFTHLTSLDMDGRFDNPVQDLISSLQYLLTNCPYLIRLSISVATRLVLGYNDVFDHLEKTIKLEQSNPDIKYAALEEVRFAVSESGVYAHTPATGGLKQYRLLEVLSLILRPATQRTKSLYFYVPVEPTEARSYGNHWDQIVNEKSKFLDFPNLRKLEISGAADQLAAFDRFVSLDCNEVKELKGLVDFRGFDREKFATFVKRFPSLHTLNIRNTPDFETNVHSSPEQPWFQTSPWQYIRNSIVLPRYPSLKVLKIGTTVDHRLVVEEELGWEVTTKMCSRLEMRSRGFIVVREIFVPYRTFEGGKWECWEVTLYLK